MLLVVEIGALREMISISFLDLFHDLRQHIAVCVRSRYMISCFDIIVLSILGVLNIQSRSIKVLSMLWRENPGLQIEFKLFCIQSSFRGPEKRISGLPVLFNFFFLTKEIIIEGVATKIQS